MVSQQALTGAAARVQAVKEIVKIAKEHGVEAIHPGYGFLSERADFARECEKAGIAFVGPRAEVLDMMGDKTAARNVAIECGIPVIPGSEDAVSTLEEAQAFCEESGFPIIMKVGQIFDDRGALTFITVPHWGKCQEVSHCTANSPGMRF